MYRLLAWCFLCLCLHYVPMAHAQSADAPIQQLLQAQGDAVAKAKRKTVGPAIDALIGSGLPEVQTVLERWQSKEMLVSKETGLYV